ncbi:MAG TPA: hypothetical protein VFN22_12640 [Gemmatimonadales bacterium]|nr:hypothetical protein [Gemmatimonadales bacterium]
MYSTCLHCTKDLGTNDVIETLPVGRRLAFDESKGRLWVVCRHCAKWNLVPFDTRLESIDACERIFAETRMQYSTDNIGIARHREGLELVRIGPALRPEYAAWRYGDSFGKRRRRNMLLAAGGVAAMGGLWFGGAAIGLSIGGGAIQFVNYGNILYQHKRVVIRVPRPDQAPIELTPMLAAKAALVPWDDAGWAIRTKVMESKRFGKSASKVEQFIRGPEASQLLGRILGRVNHYGGSTRQVRTAVDLLEERKDIPGLLGRSGPDDWTGKTRAIRKLPNQLRLAAEMLVNEDAERVALGGELKFLEWQWKEAERLAKIGDDLELGSPLTEDINTLKDAS